MEDGFYGGITCMFNCCNCAKCNKIDENHPFYNIRKNSLKKKKWTKKNYDLKCNETNLE